MYEFVIKNLLVDPKDSYLRHNSLGLLEGVEKKPTYYFGDCRKKTYEAL